MFNTGEMIGARFDVGKVQSASYGERCWEIFWKCIAPSDLPGTVLYHGDSMASFNDSEDVFCIAVQTLDSSQVERIKTRLLQSDEFLQVAARPKFVDGSLCASEPLTQEGRIDHSGELVGDAWSARSALRRVRGQT